MRASTGLRKFGGLIALGLLLLPATGAADPASQEAWLRSRSPGELVDLQRLYRSKLEILERLHVLVNGVPPADPALINHALYDYLGATLQLRSTLDRERRGLSPSCLEFLRADHDVHLLLEDSIDHGRKAQDPYARAAHEARARLALALTSPLAALVSIDAEAGRSDFGERNETCQLKDRAAWKETYLRRYAAAARLYAAAYGIPGLVTIHSLSNRMSDLFVERARSEVAFKAARESILFSATVGLSALASMGVAAWLVEAGAPVLVTGAGASAAGLTVTEAFLPLTGYSAGEAPGKILDRREKLLRVARGVVRLRGPEANEPTFHILERRVGPSPLWTANFELETSQEAALRAELAQAGPVIAAIRQNWGSEDQALEANRANLAKVEAELRRRSR